MIALDRESLSGTTMRIDLHPSIDDRMIQDKTEESPGSSAVNERDIRRTREYVELLESVYDGVLITDRNGSIKDFNSRACDHLLCEGNELFGACILDFISGADHSILSAIWNNLEEHRYTLIEAQCIRKDTTLFPAEIAVNKLNLSRTAELCFFIRDITVRKNAQEALEEAVDRLEALDQARSQFVSNISHELRTPLTSMTYAVSNLLKGVAGEIPDSVRRYLEMLDGDTRRMLGTVNDILDLSRIDGDRFTMVMGRVPFGRIVRNGVDSVRVQADQKSVEIDKTNLRSGIFVDCDPQKMERVILNIVGNAIKFTGSGGRIEISMSDDLERKGYVLLIVADDGPGIPPEAISRVTERHFTVGDQPQGSGLGLAITREIVERHDGILTIESPVPGKSKGTRVSVSLPVAEAPAILVVDDEEKVRELLVSQITKEGYRAMEASDGAEALEGIQRRNPDAVILDLILPEVEGTEVLLRMKADKETARTPVLVITGAGINAATAQILRSFGVPALSKPWREEDLLDKLEGAFFGAAALSR